MAIKWEPASEKELAARKAASEKKPTPKKAKSKKDDT